MTLHVCVRATDVDVSLIVIDDHDSAQEQTEVVLATWAIKEGPYTWSERTAQQLELCLPSEDVRLDSIRR